MNGTVNKEAIFEEVKKRIDTDSTLKEMSPSGRCFFYGIRTVEALRKHGLAAILQAGSCQWPRITPEQDDGKCATHFGYVWSPGEGQSVLARAMGVMPEMHVWAALPNEGEIVDFTTGFFPEQARIIGNFDWPGPKPPKFVWATTSEIPRGVVYRAEMEAIKFALLSAARLYGRG